VLQWYVASQLEREGDEKGLRYSFDIKTSNTLHEMYVDAKAGKV